MYSIDVAKERPIPEEMYNTVLNMMKRGIRVDTNVIDDYIKRYTDITEGILANCKEKYGITNCNPSNSLRDFMQSLSDSISDSSPSERNDIIEIAYKEDTKTHKGKWCTDQETLGQLFDLGYEFAGDILEYRKANKYLSSLKEIKNHCDGNGLIHSVVSLTKTNRISYSEPALMNIPKKLLWDVIIPYDSDNVLYSVDIKNQEPTILANIVQDSDLISALNDDCGFYESMFKKVFRPTVTMNCLYETLPEDRIYSGSECQELGYISPALYMPVKAKCSGYYISDNMGNQDKIVQIETVCQGYSNIDNIEMPSTVKVLGESGNVYKLSVDWEYVNLRNDKKDFELTGYINGLDTIVKPEERKEFKVSWLALTYGSSSNSITANCKHIDGRLICDYFNNISGMKLYKKNIDKLINSGITTINTVFGNKLTAVAFNKSALRRSMLDLPIQGTGADVLNCLIKHFNSEVTNRGLSGVMSIYYTRHDELIIEISKDYVTKAGADCVNNVLRDILEHEILLTNSEDGTVKWKWTPFKVEIERLSSNKQLDKELGTFEMVDEE